MSIEEYEFVDNQITDASPLKYASMVGVDLESGESFCIHKLDVIALAKHFKLTADDIS